MKIQVLAKNSLLIFLFLKIFEEILKSREGKKKKFKT